MEGCPSGESASINSPSSSKSTGSDTECVMNTRRNKMGKAEVVFGRDYEQAACLKTAYFGGEWGWRAWWWWVGVGESARSRLLSEQDRHAIPIPVFCFLDVRDTGALVLPRLAAFLPVDSDAAALLPCPSPLALPACPSAAGPAPSIDCRQ
jgi:hypothetical protein